MTPKEKAKELVNKMYGVTDYQAKQSALIAVDEILKANAIWYNGSTPHKYWTKVKQEIEKL